MSARRELATSVLAIVAGSGLMLVGSGAPWARATASAAAGLPGVLLEPTGRVLVPAVGALALVTLAGVLALAATRGAGRLLVGAVTAVAGAVALVLTVRAGLDPVPGLNAEAEEALGGTPSRLDAVERTLWPWVVAVGALAATAGGALALVRGRHWASLGGRYDAPVGTSSRGQADAAGQGSTPAGPPVPDRDLWAAQDRGEDLTR